MASAYQRMHWAERDIDLGCRDGLAHVGSRARRARYYLIDQIGKADQDLLAVEGAIFA
jgi:hypothetical protein